MDFEHNDENTQDNPQIDVGTGLVDAHFGITDLLSPNVVSVDSGSSISSPSPPQDWQAPVWMENTTTAPTTGVDPSLFTNLANSGLFDLTSGGLTDFSEVNSIGNLGNLGVGMSMHMYNSGFPIMLSPAEAQAFQSLAPQTMMPLVNTGGSIALGSEDIAAAVKRLTGITNAQIAGAPSTFTANTHEQYGIPPVFSDNSYSSASSDRSSVPPQAVDSVEVVQAGTPSDGGSMEMAPITPVTGRPKTAHTTIERRYRTNLNTCIVGLRNAIPAVRYLDKSYKHPSGIPDTVDDNGCVDGVKVARKISKATIMSKAREYINVLKKRETRLQDEVNGLKSLISSLVGGQILLQEWERQWSARQAAEAADDEMDSGDMGSDDGEEEDSAEERPRKKAKISPIVAEPPPLPKAKKAQRPVAPAAPSGGVTIVNVEAPPKKRGRPSKAVVAARQAAAAGSATPTAPSSMQVSLNRPTMSAPPPITAAQTQYSFVSVLPQQPKKPAVFFAGFVFLSFFKPTHRHAVLFNEETNNHSHLGRVLNTDGDQAATVRLVQSGWHSHPITHFLHTAVLVLLFIGLVITLVPQKIRYKVWRYFGSFFEIATHEETIVDEEETSDEESLALAARAEKELKAPSSTNKSKLNVFNNLYTMLSSSSTCEELGLLALLRYPSKPAQAQDLWMQALTAAREHDPLRNAFAMSLEKGLEVIQQAAASRDTRPSLAIIASKVVEAHIERVFKDAFIDEVVAICEQRPSSVDILSTKQTRDKLFKQAAQLGGAISALQDVWDAALAGRVFGINDEEGQTPVHEILQVISLMRRVFPTTSRSCASGLPSPPPSPLSQDEYVKLERLLRVNLDSKVFHSYTRPSSLENEEVAVDKERSEEVRRARDMLVSRLSHAARVRRMAALDEDET
ncbi:hypothetical protein FRC17_007426 [Serendipita sp. 399]|nr:hypothetical protein FRC17_007426 [Serendipita sp. 399]